MLLAYHYCDSTVFMPTIRYNILTNSRRTADGIVCHTDADTCMHMSQTQKKCILKLNKAQDTVKENTFCLWVCFAKLCAVLIVLKMFLPEWQPVLSPRLVAADRPLICFPRFYLASLEGPLRGSKPVVSVRAPAGELCVDVPQSVRCWLPGGHLCMPCRLSPDWFGSSAVPEQSKINLWSLHKNIHVLDII